MPRLAATLGAAGYRLASVIHWPPRERAVLSALEVISKATVAPVRRVLDIGSGPGLLADAVVGRGIDYVGIEPEQAFVDACSRRWRSERATFRRATVRTMAMEVYATDVVVLNGVAHHLDDAELDVVLRLARGAGGLVICDHWRRPGEVGALARWLQGADRGKHVRDIGFFEALPGFRALKAERFPITVGCIELWPYFCLAYRPDSEV